MAGAEALGFVLSGCGGTSAEPPSTAESSAPAEPSGSAEQPQPQESQNDEALAQEEQEEPMQILVTVNGVAFTATVADTKAGEQLVERLPMTLSMEELHGNEKYCYTGEGFDGQQFVPQTIEAGDLMVFGSDCLVLFYETFANDGWSYQSVGKIDDVAGLADACGSGSVTVTFEAVA